MIATLTHLALIFTAPAMLFGLLGAGIPFLLHLLSRVQAKEEPFPTLRFLKLSIEKNARRRRLEHWLLLLLRSLVLGILAMALAEPVSEATGGWLGGKDHASAVVLDNSFSMSARQHGGDAFSRAKAQVESLLSGEDKPAMAVLLPAIGSPGATEAQSRLDTLRTELASTAVRYGPTDLAGRVMLGIEALNAQSVAEKHLYLLTDLQAETMETILALPNLAVAEKIKFFIIHPPARPVNNTGIVAAELTGQPVVGSPMTLLATVENFSPQARTVDMTFQTDGQPDQQVLRELAPAGKPGAKATLTFTLLADKPGPLAATLRLGPADDLMQDNIRHVALNVSPKIQALVVTGPADASASSALQPGWLLSMFLDWRSDDGQDVPWPIELETLPAAEFTNADFGGKDIIFFCDIPRINGRAVSGILAFVKRGGTACFTLGPATHVRDYNRFLKPLLGGKLSPAVGQVGADAPADPVGQVATTHPLLTGLFKNASDYRRPLTWRHFPLAVAPENGEALLSLPNGDPLVLLRKFGSGRAIWVTVPSTPGWSQLPHSGLFLSAMHRATMASCEHPDWLETFPAGRPVVLRPRPGPMAAVRVTSPESSGPSQIETLPIGPDRTAVLPAPSAVGLYQWTIPPSKQKWFFAVNPYGPESDLRRMTPEAMVAALAKKGITAYAAETPQQARTLAAKAGEGKNYWDLLILLAILILTGEAVLANRKRTAKK